MMEFIVNLLKNTKGIFLPRTVHHDELADDFFASQPSLTYYGPECDRRNIRSDVSRLGQMMKDTIRVIKKRNL